MKVFYARVSTAEQNEARQLALAESIGAEKVFVDKQSGKNTDRPELKAMLSFVREGDTLAVESISRLARSTKDLLAIVDELTNKGVAFVSQKESIDTSTPQGKFMLTVFAAMAELERENILQRQAEGIAIAKAEGKYKGRKRIEYDTKEFNALVSKVKAGEMTATAAMKKLNMKPNTFYRRMNEAAHKKGEASNV